MSMISMHARAFLGCFILPRFVRLIWSSRPPGSLARISVLTNQYAGVTRSDFRAEANSRKERIQAEPKGQVQPGKRRQCQAGRRSDQMKKLFSLGSSFGLI